MQTRQKKISWLNTSFMVLTPFIALVGVPFLIWTDQLRGATWILTFVLAILSGLSITAGYHRLYSHRSYEASWPVRLFFLLFGAATFENSARKWCSDHREHHQHVDQEPDPYNIQKGFWHAHIGWILYQKEPGHQYDNVPDMMQDPLVRFQDRYYFIIAAFFGLFLPMGIAALWGDPWGGLILAGVARVVFNHHSTFLINSLCHYIGKQPYSDQNSSRDSSLMAFLTYGEGYHNFHHAFQADYRNGFRGYHWDPAKWMIRFFSWVKLTKNLRQIPKEKILFTKLRMQEKCLLEKAMRGKTTAQLRMENLIKGTRLKFEEAYSQFCKLKTEYRKLKKSKMSAMEDQLHLLKREIQKTKQTLKEARISWIYLYRTVLRGGSFAVA